MKLAFKEIKYNWKKYLMVEVLVVLLIFMVIFLTGLANGLGKALSSGIENLNAPYLILDQDSEKMIGMSRISQLEYQSVKETDPMATPLIIQHTQIISENKSDKIDVTYFAIDPSQRLNPSVSEGLQLDTSENVVVLDKSLEDSGIKVGDIISDSETDIELKVLGFVDNQSYSHTPVAFISIPTYKNILETVSSSAEVRFNAIAIDKNDVQIDGLEVVDKVQAVESMPGYLAEQLTIKMIIWVLVIVSAAILAVFFYILTIQKLKQIGVLKAIGFSVVTISKIQLIQIASISVFGAFLALISALGLGSIMPSSMPFYTDMKEIIFVSLAFIVIAIASSMVSILNISKVDANSIIGKGDE